MDPHAYDNQSREGRVPVEGPHVSSGSFEPQQQQVDQLQEAVILAENTVDVGASILAQLGSQRMNLLSARETMQETDRGLNQTSKIMRKMFARAKTTKVLLYAIVLVLIAVIILLIYAKLNH